MFKKLFLLIVCMGLFSLPVASQAGVSCGGVVITAPDGQLPVFNGPSYQSIYTNSYLILNQHITVSGISFTKTTGEIWLSTGDGWVQSYSGYTTGVTSIVLGDYLCAQALPIGVQ